MFFSQMKVIGAFGRFVDKLPKGMSWSVRHIEAQIKKGNQELKYAYKWIKNNIRTDSGGIDWLYVIINILGIERQKRNPFMYRNKDLLNIEDNFYTLEKVKDISDSNLGRGLIDEGTLAIDPQSYVLLQEEELILDKQRELLNKAIVELSKGERRIIDSFYRGEEVEGLEDLLLKLRDIFRENSLDYKEDVVLG